MRMGMTVRMLSCSADPVQLRLITYMVICPTGFVGVSDLETRVLIENGTTGLQAHVCYWDRGWRVSVTMAAVCMEVEETGMKTGHRGTYNRPPSWE